MMTITMMTSTMMMMMMMTMMIRGDCGVDDGDVMVNCLLVSTRAIGQQRKTRQRPIDSYDA
jgi:hypothetical protein